MSQSQSSFFDAPIAAQLAKMNQINDFIPKLNALIDWEIFREPLSQVREKERLSPAGRPPFDALLMFKVLVLKTIHNLSDDQREYQIRDRLSFKNFLGLTILDRIPDAKTIWLFADQLKSLGLERVLFDRFEQELQRQGFAVKSGLIADGTIVEVPKQRHSQEENEHIKAGDVPARIADHAHVLAQKDLDADWKKKNNISYFGYENHALADEGHKFIRDYDVTPASVHDSVPYLPLMPKKPAYPDQEAFGDSAYKSKEIDTELAKRGFVPQICERCYRNNPLTESQKESNKVKSSVRCRVEHIFGAMKVRCRDEILRSIGFERARFWIGMRNLAYNLGRLVSLKCPKPKKGR
jgi:IS5 family transposase